MAHAYLSMSAASRIHFASDSHFLDLAESEARAALRLGPSLADGHRALAGVLYQKGQLRAALEEQMRALQLGGPEEHVMVFVGMTLETLGQPDRALPWYEMARRRATYPGMWDSLIGDSWSRLLNDEQAEIAYRRAIDLQSDMPHGWVGIARLRLLHGDFGAARAMCREHQGREGRSSYPDQMAAMVEFFARNFSEARRLYTMLEQENPDGGGTFYGGMSYKSVLGRLNIEKNAAGPARRLLEECLVKEHRQLDSAPGNPEVLYRLAAIESSLGKTESAIAHLESAVSAGWLDYRSLSLDPRFDTIADDIRFQTILGKLKLKIEALRKETKTDTRTKNKKTPETDEKME